METLFATDAFVPTKATTRSRRKAEGVHYTPEALARFMARRALGTIAPMRERSPADGRGLTVLDPACGDGELLLAVAAEAAAAGLREPHLVGIDNDADAVALARRRLSGASASVRCADFLAVPSAADPTPLAAFDMIISNPPYVRTQVLGARRAQALGRQFGLGGRVDLYHAFVAAMTDRLAEGGVLSLLCSNRFLTTKGGASLRSIFARRYDIAELWDLGDTKMFEAAVLPAVVVARRRRGSTRAAGSFTRVYEEASAPDAQTSTSLLVALEDGLEGSVVVGTRRFVIERGELVESTPERPWRVTSSRGSRWLAAVSRHSDGRLADIGPIRVGIKTTADGVFVRHRWDDLPREMVPESELIHPLLTHRVAARWRADVKPEEARSVLYPHESHGGRRRTVDLAEYPRAAAYLDQHRVRLEGRRYVRAAGRAWYEIWVPQQPDAWFHPKLVWPDISARPRFFLDETGAIVNGDCYWLSCVDRSPQEIALALAVANSSFALRYYDLCCGNRLYAGRRRFITQYLEELPLPAVTNEGLCEIAAWVDQLRAAKPVAEPEEMAMLEQRLDDAVNELFGIAHLVG